MRAPKTLSRIGCLLLALLAAPLPALQSGAAPETADGGWNLDRLMAGLAERRGESGEARFTEVKTLTSLERPLLAEGVLRYRYPSSLEKEVHKPRAERYVIQGDSMEIYRDGKLRRQVRLDDYPALRSFFSSFIATMGGDLDALRDTYSLHLEGSHTDWTLRLTPIGPELQRIVKRITVRGQGSDIRSFETLQPNDDNSLMLITPLG